VQHAHPRHQHRPPLDPRPPARVIASAVQHGNGRIADPAVIVGGADAGLTTTEVRHPAALLLEAADELDEWIR
jgi:hypothetical protein